MRGDCSGILGKTIQSVVVKECANHKLMQLFLVFEDGTHYEFYSPTKIVLTGGVDRGGLEWIRQYMGPECEVILEETLNQGSSQ